MASGRPDYFKGVDVTYQSLSEVTNRPKYGGAIITLFGGPVVASVSTELMSIAGKGMLYGGFLYLDYTSTQRDSRMQIVIDGSEVIDPTFGELNKYSIRKPGAYPVVLNKFDDVNFIYSVSMPERITFETSIVVSYSEAHGTTPTVTARLVYALI